MFFSFNFYAFLMIDYATQSFYITDDGIDAFEKILAKINLIKGKQILVLSKRTILRNHAWHLSTLLNTFNTYYCYDAHPRKDMRRIRPIYVKFDKDSNYRRLLSIEIIINDNDKEGFSDDVVFHFDDENTAIKIRRVAFYDFIAMVDREYTSEYQGLYDVAQDEIGVRYTNSLGDEEEEENTNTLAILPFKCDLTVYVNRGESLSGLHTGLFVDRAYVATSRISTSERDYVDCRSPYDQSFFDDMSDEDKKALTDYIFGSDLGFLNANFDNDGQYRPRYHIYWDTRVPSKHLTRMTKPKYKLLYLPSTIEEEGLLSMKTYDSAAYERQLKIQITDTVKENTLYLSIVDRTIHIIESLVRPNDKLLSFGSIDDDDDDSDWVDQKMKFVDASVKKSRYELEIEQENEQLTLHRTMGLMNDVAAKIEYILEK